MGQVVRRSSVGRPAEVLPCCWACSRWRSRIAGTHSSRSRKTSASRRMGASRGAERTERSKRAFDDACACRKGVGWRGEGWCCLGEWCAGRGSLRAGRLGVAGLGRGSFAGGVVVAFLTTSPVQKGLGEKEGKRESCRRGQKRNGEREVRLSLLPPLMLQKDG